MVVRVSQGTLSPWLFHFPVLTILGPSRKSCLPTSLCSHWPLSPWWKIRGSGFASLQSPFSDHMGWLTVLKQVERVLGRCPKGRWLAIPSCVLGLGSTTVRTLRSGLALTLAGSETPSVPHKGNPLREWPVLVKIRETEKPGLCSLHSSALPGIRCLREDAK